MAFFAAPRVKRRTVVTIAFLLFLTCLACYLLAPYCKTLANWLPFASSLDNTLHGSSHQSAPTQSMSLVAGTGAPSSAASVVPSTALATTPTPTPTPAPTPTVTPTPVPSSVVVAAKPKATPTSSAPPVAKATTAAPPPAVVVTSPPPAAQQTVESFSPHSVNAAPPANLSGANRNGTYMAWAALCAQTGSSADCFGLQWGTSESCQYPAYRFTPVAFSPTQAGWAMYQFAPGECRYAMLASR